MLLIFHESDDGRGSRNFGGPQNFNPHMSSRSILASCATAALILFTAPLHSFAGDPPAGFTALFNGTDLTGWRGGSTFDPRKLQEMPEDQRKAQIDKWTSTLTATNDKTGKPHWYAENGELVNDGFGDYATT